MLKEKLSSLGIPVPVILDTDTVSLVHNQATSDDGEILLLQGVEGCPPEQYSLWLLNPGTKAFQNIGRTQTISKSAP